MSSVVKGHYPYQFKPVLIQNADACRNPPIYNKGVPPKIVFLYPFGCKGKKTPEKERHVRQKMYICIMWAGEMAPHCWKAFFAFVLRNEIAKFRLRWMKGTWRSSVLCICPCTARAVSVHTKTAWEYCLHSFLSKAFGDACFLMDSRQVLTPLFFVFNLNAGFGGLTGKKGESDGAVRTVGGAN